MLVVEPLATTQVAELVVAPALDVVAAHCLLHHALTVGTLPKVQIVLEEVYLVALAGARVLGEQALVAINFAALPAPGVHSFLQL